MKAYHFSELRPGLAASFQVKVTPEMVDAFCALSGDQNPLHTDAAFAGQKGFPDRVAHGMLVASFYSTLAGMHLPGKHALLHEVESAFVAPVFPGDELTVSGEIIFVHEAFRQIEIKAQIINQKGEKVSRAKIRCGVQD